MSSYWQPPNWNRRIQIPTGNGTLFSKSTNSTQPTSTHQKNASTERRNLFARMFGKRKKPESSTVKNIDDSPANTVNKIEANYGKIPEKPKGHGTPIFNLREEAWKNAVKISDEKFAETGIRIPPERMMPPDSLFEKLNEIHKSANGLYDRLGKIR